jgi:hypothetical protein
MDAQGGSAEPIRLTLADVMMVVIGVAAGFVFEPVREETTLVVQTCGFVAPVATYPSVYWTLERVALPAAVGVVLVVLARRAWFCGMPRAGEWLAIVVALLLLDAAVPGDDHVGGPVTTRPMTYQEIDGVQVPTRKVRPAVLTAIDAERPLAPALLDTAELGAAVLLAGWIMVGASRRNWPACALAALLGVLACVWLRWQVRLNPVEVVRFRYSWVKFRPLGPPAGWSVPAYEWYLEGRLALGRWAIGLFTAVPAMAACRDLLGSGRTGRRWTEWAGLILAAVMGASWTIDELALRPAPALVVRASVFAVWLAAVAASAWVVVQARQRLNGRSSRAAGWPMERGGCGARGDRLAQRPAVRRH